MKPHKKPWLVLSNLRTCPVCQESVKQFKEEIIKWAEDNKKEGYFYDIYDPESCYCEGWNSALQNLINYLKK